MILPDVNVLVYAFRQDSPHHETCRKWLEDLISADGSYAVTGLALSGFLRVVTHPAVFNQPSSLRAALKFTRALRDQPNCLVISPGARHWGIFERLCRESNARGNLIPDAYLAALAIEAGCEFATLDRDFGQFAGLRTVNPLR